MKKYIFENDSDQTLTVSYETEMFLISVEGVSKAEYDIETVKQAGLDGERYNGGSRAVRHIDFVLGIPCNYDLYSDKLHAFFAEGIGGTMYSCLGPRTRKIRYTPAGVEVDPAGALREASISITCPDPMFKDKASTITSMANWEDLIIFPVLGGLQIPVQFDVTRKVSSLIKSIYNSSGVTSGLIIEFYATGAVRMPCLINVNRHEQIQLKDTLPLQNGDRVRIDTEALTVMLFRAGQTSNIITSKKYGSKWLQLYPADNLFRYDAVAGINNLSVTIESNQLYGSE
ncbi:MAG: phage tail family protein [Oscillospiraceae bacterium]